MFQVVQHVSPLYEDDLRDEIFFELLYSIHLQLNVCRVSKFRFVYIYITFKLHSKSPCTFTANKWQKKISEKEIVRLVQEKMTGYIHRESFATSSSVITGF
jgi:hypothetical protein